MKLIHRVAIPIALLVFYHGILDAQPTSGNLFDRPPYRELVASWSGVMSAVHVQGMVVGVIRGDSTATIALGFGDADGRIPTSANSPAYIASVTKVFVAQAIMQLAQVGKVDLDAPVRTYLPRFRLADSIASASITVRDLLCHRKGLASWPMTFGEAFTGQMTEDRYYSLLARVKPDGDFEYSNLHYTLLGRVIESVTGGSWKAYVKERVLAPAGLGNTGMSVAPLANDNAMQPLEHAGGAYRVTDERKTDRTMHAAGGMVSTANDLLHWLQLQMNNGRGGGKQVIPEQVVLAMRTSQIALPEEHPFIPDQSRTGWGLGWMLREHRGSELVVHTGNFAGTAAFVGYMPKERVGVVVLANAKEQGMWLNETVAAQLFDRLLGLSTPSYKDPLPPWFIAPGDVPSEEPAAIEEAGRTLPTASYAGQYSEPDWGDVDVWLDGNELRMRIGDLPLPLAWTGANTFIAGGDHEGSFIIEGNGVVAIELGMPLPDKARFTRVR